MTTLIEEYINLILTSNSIEEILPIITMVTNQLGFERFSYGYKNFLNIDRRICIVNNYDEKWNEKYLKNNLAKIDPLVKLGMKTTSPIVWHEIKNVNNEFWEEPNQYGICEGWSKSIHYNNTSAALISFCRSADIITESELKLKRSTLLWLVSVIEYKFKELNNVSNEKESCYLTPREVEVMKWTTIGKTSSEISKILNISERTVIWHINNAVIKLDCPNRLTAAIKFLSFGFLYH
ncbi:LuxR family transcriptional regulator [Vibrio aestuarianus subsp. cardii]|uniref:LuxR family transcriptional regulator n=1 Tax=Vibrio aestuarianus TaxID=28171 RepID=UPI001592D365|nr:LuxR family transcriptional regulator [Vibrio aestuarianus]MDE1310372.1 LuxR family transcriptional regulator [Vibrio aestuarianus]NGZ94477.1 LuxR family transcriptional regulator [Vibrio aestuarianus subsp. cardii]